MCYILGTYLIYYNTIFFNIFQFIFSKFFIY